MFDHVWSDPLKDVSLRASGGLRVIVGDESDGAGALIELCAGVRAPRRGRIALDGGSPSTSPRCRRRIASLLPAEAPMAGGSDVRRWLGELGALRAISPGAVLERCSVAGERPLRSLSGAERRELACWVALAQPDAALVVLADPLAACGAGQRQALLARIAELAATTSVLLTTPSIAEARVLGGSVWRLDRGLLDDGSEPASSRGAWHGAAGAAFTLDAVAPRALLAALAREADVHEIRYDEANGGRVLVRGAELEPLASAVARAVVSASADVRSLRAGADDLDALRAAASAMNDAAGVAYRAAHARERAASTTPELGAPAAPRETAAGSEPVQRTPEGSI